MVTRLPTLSIYILLGVFLMIPAIALAGVGQSDSSTRIGTGVSSGLGAASVGQELGTGFEGTFDEFSLYLEASGSAWVNVRFFTCTAEWTGFPVAAGPPGCVEDSSYQAGTTDQSFPVAGSKTLYDFELTSPITADPAKYYYFIVRRAELSGTIYAFGNTVDAYPLGDCQPDTKCDTVTDLYFFFSGVDNGTIPPDDIRTRIDAVSPADGETIATSTPTDVGASGYVNPDDFREGMRLRVKVDRLTDQQAVGALLAFESAFGNYQTYEITSSGEFDFATSTEYDRVGKYTIYSMIERPTFSFLGAHFFQTKLVATSTSFVVGVKTGVDYIIDTGAETLEDLIEAQSDPLAACQFEITTILDFSSESNLFSCIGGIASALMIPNAQQTQDLLEQARQTFLYKAPWGYATLVFDAFTASSTPETLPSLTLEIPTGPMEGRTIDLTPWEGLAGEGSIFGEYVSPFTGNAILPLLLTAWNTLCLAGFAFWLLRLFGRHSEGSSNVH